MIELETDMWHEAADAHVITTNGDVNANGEAVMGRGCAYEAKGRFRGLAESFGSVLRGQDSNHVHDLGEWHRNLDYDEVFHLVSFPVKHHWHQRAVPELIKRSAMELVELVDAEGWTRVIVARPGCGNGSLQWKNVKPILEPVFDDRFVVVHRRSV